MNTFTSPAGSRILVVDDEQVTRTAITKALNLMGYYAEVAESGAQALEKLAVQSFDLMLLDLRMPGLNGIDVMERVHRDYPSVKVIVLTAHGTLESAIAAIRVGVDNYLLKPSSIRDIEAAIAQALQRRSDELMQRELLQTITQAVDALRETGRTQQGPRSDQQAMLATETVLFNRETRQVMVRHPDATPLQAELTENEAVLLACFMERAGRVLSASEMAGALGYQVDEPEAQELVRPHISRLRKKIESSPNQPDLIKTVRGRGYIFDA